MYVHQGKRDLDSSEHRKIADLFHNPIRENSQVDRTDDSLSILFTLTI